MLPRFRVLCLAGAAMARQAVAISRGGSAPAGVMSNCMCAADASSQELCSLVQALVDFYYSVQFTFLALFKAVRWAPGVCSPNIVLMS